MRIGLLALSFGVSLALSASAMSAPVKRACGTRMPTEQEKLMREEHFLNTLDQLRAAGQTAAATGPVTVNVYWHNITNSSGQGAVPSTRTPST